MLYLPTSFVPRFLALNSLPVLSNPALRIHFTACYDMASSKTAIVSVYDKTGVVDFCKALVAAGWTVISTGGTEKALREAEVKVTAVSDITAFPEILGGRVKTLHPAVRKT